MKRKILLGCAALLLTVLLSGRVFWMDGEYLSVTPHAAQEELAQKAAAEVTSYAQLCNVLTDMVENYREECIISIVGFNNATTDYYISAAIDHVRKNTAVGAFGVEKIDYEVGVNRSTAVVAMDIYYTRTRADILGMNKVRNTEEMTARITQALEHHDAYVVMRTDEYQTVDFTQLVQNYANEHPDLIMETPQVSVFVYPQRGQDRIVELTFTYRTDRESLRKMQEQVSPVFTSAELYVKETTQVRDIYARLYSFLMERDEYTLETSITPSYSLLHHGVGDSRAFANVYAAMCRNADLDCTVISGTRDSEPWCWNLVRFRGKYYHVDLLGCSEKGKFEMLSASEMDGYVWDYSAHPSS